MRKSRAVVAAAATLAIAAPALAAAVAGAPGVGDPFFPLAGNGGIDVSDYSLQLAYDPATRHLEGTATLSVRATQDLSRFDLDLRGFSLGTVRVDGAAATTARDGQELQITPAESLHKGETFTVVVPYSGTPQVVTDPDDSIEGWVPTDDGAAVVNEPQGSPAWYPVNDTPRDKATFTVAMEVPDGLTAVGNGRLVSKTSSAGHTTFKWREGYPMAPYLATITLGRFNVTEGRTPGGVDTYIAVDSSLGSSASSSMKKLPRMVDFLVDLYGAYPFENAGAIVDNAPDIGYSLETQTKPFFDDAPDAVTVLHELAHMWFGDAVTLKQWPDIWLHEGFATWSEWIWTERQGNQTAAQQLKQLENKPAKSWLWSPPPGNVGSPAELFSGVVYERGAMTLEALRERIGDATFFRLLRTWYAENRYGNVTTADFVRLAERISGRELSDFFDAWLYQDGKPAAEYL
jgi:aminopeptidase N